MTKGELEAMPTWCFEGPSWEKWKREKLHREWSSGAKLAASMDGGPEYEWRQADVWLNPLRPSVLYCYSDSGCSCNSPYEDFEPEHFDVCASYAEFEAWCPKPSEYGYSLNDVSRFKQAVRDALREP